MYRHEIATGQFGMVSARVKMSLGESRRDSSISSDPGETFRAKKSCQESRIGLYAWHPAILSPKLVFVYAGGRRA